MIVKHLLSDWSSKIKQDLKGVPFAQIARGTGVNIQTIRNYILLTGQERFDPAIVEKINKFRDEYLALAESLSGKPAEALADA